MKEVEYYWVILDNEIKTIATPVREYDGLNWYVIGAYYHPVNVKVILEKIPSLEESREIKQRIMALIEYIENYIPEDSFYLKGLNHYLKLKDKFFNVNKA